MTIKSNNKIRKAATILAILVLFGVMLPDAYADEKSARISDLKKDDLNEEDNDALREYYGKVFDVIGENSKFNNIAAKDNIAVINVTIDGRDRRILTKLATGVVMPKIADKLVAALLEAGNVTVFDQLKVLGRTIFSAVTAFGERNFYGIEGSEARYVDEGSSRLAGGKANVSINPALRELISGYNVYLSAQGLTKGIYVAEKSNSYFVIKSVNPASNVGFSWMLRGVKKDSDKKLESQIGKENGIGITAIIDNENGTTRVRIAGLDKIIEMTSGYINNITNNSNHNESNPNNATNSIPNGPSIQLITGNLVDEFGLETDLGKILSEKPAELPDLGNGNQGTAGNKPNDENSNKEDFNLTDKNASEQNIPTGIAPIEANKSANGTDYSVLEFTLFSVDEGLIVNEISIVTGLTAEDASKLITFVYADPNGSEDEIIEPSFSAIEGIEKVNGSVIVRLG